MSQFLRPNEDISAGSWTYSTGSSLYGCIDETSYSDTDYIRGGTLSTSYTYATIGLSDPGGTPDAGTVTLRIRYRKHNGYAVGKLMCGATVIKDFSSSLTASDYATLTVNLTTEQRDAITDWSDLRLYLGGGSNDGESYGYLYVSWAELETPDNVVELQGIGLELGIVA